MMSSIRGVVNTNHLRENIMTKLDILNIIIKLLVLDNAQGLDNPKVKTHLDAVATAIHAEAGEVPAPRLISLAYNESRFGYKEIKLDSYPTTSWGACGIYQQVAKFSTIPTTCHKLGTDVRHATKVAVAYLKYMKGRWKVTTSTEKMDDLMCHYYSGNTCDAAAKAYAKRHKKIREKASELLASKKAKKAKGLIVASRKGLPPRTI